MPKNRKRNLFPGEGVSVQVVPCEDGIGIYVEGELTGMFLTEGADYPGDAAHASIETLEVLGYSVNTDGSFEFPDDVSELPESLEGAIDIAEAVDSIDYEDDEDDPDDDDDTEDDDEVEHLY